MYIHEIKPVGKAKVRICPEDGADFVLYRKEAAMYELAGEAELPDEKWQIILQETLIPRAKKRAMHLLEQMDRSEAQLQRKLQEGGYPPEACEAALAYVASFHYTDDERLAMNYVRAHGTERSRRRVLQDLLQKGVPEEIAQRALEAEYPDSEQQLIEKLMAKRGYDCHTATQEERMKQFRFLGTKGFAVSDIISVLDTFTKES